LELANDGVMAIRERIALHDDLLADRSLDGVAAAVDLGTDRFDDDARRRWLIQA
jgi:hypothetical protein